MVLQIFFSRQLRKYLILLRLKGFGHFKAKINYGDGVLEDEGIE
jgi:hypothetical protein